MGLSTCLLGVLPLKYIARRLRVIVGDNYKLVNKEISLEKDSTRVKIK